MDLPVDIDGLTWGMFASSLVLISFGVLIFWHKYLVGDKISSLWLGTLAGFVTLPAQNVSHSKLL